MTITLNGLRPEEQKILHEMVIGAYLDGECYAFAIALHRGIGWPLVGLMENGVIRHAAVRSPKNGLYDARGPFSEEEFGSPFSINPPYELREISEDDLRVVRYLRESTIESASKMASALWPSLPWKKDSFQGRVLAFAKALEQISREHGIWIIGSSPGSPAVLTYGFGGELGYRLSSTHDGLASTINRQLDSG